MRYKNKTLEVMPFTYPKYLTRGRVGGWFGGGNINLQKFEKVYTLYLVPAFKAESEDSEGAKL